jgi:hypothetical protein
MSSSALIRSTALQLTVKIRAGTALRGRSNDSLARTGQTDIHMRFAAPCIHCHNNILFHASLQHLKLVIPWLVWRGILACSNGGGHFDGL